MSLQVVRQHIESSPMRACQLVVIGLCVAVNMLDGLRYPRAVTDFPNPVARMASGPPRPWACCSVRGWWVRRSADSPYPDRRYLGTPHRHPDQPGTDEHRHDAVGHGRFSRHDWRPCGFCTGLGVGANAGCVGTLAFEYSPLKAARWRWAGRHRLYGGHLVGRLRRPTFARRLRLARNTLLRRWLLHRVLALVCSSCPSHWISWPRGGAPRHSCPQQGARTIAPSGTDRTARARYESGAGGAAGPAASADPGAHRPHGPRLLPVHGERVFLPLTGITS